jgi:hypothetical protein
VQLAYSIGIQLQALYLHSNREGVVRVLPRSCLLHTTPSSTPLTASLHLLQPQPSPPPLSYPTPHAHHRSQGCLDESCALCQYNTERRCRLNFASKYLVNDRLTARCGATIRLELLERGSGQVYEGEMPDVVLEVGVDST